MAAFDQVTEQAGRVLIVASGPSAMAMDLSLVKQARAAGVYVLGVNRAWDWCPHLNGWFTLDPDYLVLKYIVNEPLDESVQRYVAIPPDYGRQDARVAYHRNMPRFPGIVYLRRVQGGGLMKSHPGLSASTDAIHTGNSAYGALGLACHMKPSRIALVGVDAKKHEGYAHLHGRPKYSLHHLPALFATTLDQLDAKDIQVKNGSPDSLVTCFPRCTPNDAIAWLLEGVGRNV